MIEQTMSIDSKGQLSQTDVYYGLGGSYLQRGEKTYQENWAQKKIASFDNLVETSIQNAVQQGKSTVVIFDLGCGQANLFREYLSTNPDRPSLRLLSENPNLKLKLIGLTDANDENPALVHQDLIDPKNQNSQIEAFVSPFTITASQNIQDYFQKEGITDIDICTASYSLQYLPPKTFDRTVHQVIDHLAVGGRFIAISYTAGIPGYIDHEVAFDPDLSHSKATTKPSPVNAMRDKYGHLYQGFFKSSSEPPYHSIVETDPQRLEFLRQSYLKLIDQMLSTGALKPQDVSQTIDKYRVYPKKGFSQYLYRLLQPEIPSLDRLQLSNENEINIFYNIVSSLAGKGSQHRLDDTDYYFKVSKDATLKKVIEEYGQKITVNYDEKFIDIIKRS